MGDILSKIVVGIRDVIDITPPGKYMNDNRRGIIVFMLIMLYVLNFLDIEMLDKLKSIIILFTLCFTVLYVN